MTHQMYYSLLDCRYLNTSISKTNTCNKLRLLKADAFIELYVFIDTKLNPKLYVNMKLRLIKKFLRPYLELCLILSKLCFFNYV